MSTHSWTPWTVSLFDISTVQFSKHWSSRWLMKWLASWDQSVCSLLCPFSGGRGGRWKSLRWRRMKWIICATHYGCKTKCSLYSCRYSRHVVVPLWCGVLVYSLVTSMLTSMDFLGGWYFRCCWESFILCNTCSLCNKWLKVSFYESLVVIQWGCCIWRRWVFQAYLACVFQSM